MTCPRFLRARFRPTGRASWMRLRGGPAWTLLFAILPALCDCQSRPPEWTKPGATIADLRRDLADCEREGTGTPPFRFWALNEDYETARDRIRQLKSECMAARGWQQTSSGTVLFITAGVGAQHAQDGT